MAWADQRRYDAVKLSDINIRDPFILPDCGRYYMYGTRGREAWGGKCTGLDVYVSDDLENWTEPREAFTRPADFWADENFWAPEVHKYGGRYYMLASFKKDGVCRGTQILAADSPEGPFTPHSDGPVTPRDWECLDGTLYIEDGVPYMVFCHEWLQVHDGEMCALRLSDDLKCAVGEPVVLFRASEPEWAIKGADNYVTDGPFMYRTQGGKLLMIWSSSAAQGYCEAISYAEDGKLLGKWRHDPRLLFERDGGHGMIFRTNDGQLKFTLHQPNSNPDERPHIIDLVERDDTLYAG